MDSQSIENKRANFQHQDSSISGATDFKTQQSGMINYQSEDENVLKNYKKKLFGVVTGIFIICIIIIIERIFNEIFEEWESDWIASIQKSFGLVKEKDGYMIFEDNFFFKMIGYTSIFQINMLILTHIFITLYVGIDAIVAIKLLYVMLMTYFASSCMDMVYSGPRPYWISNSIAAPVCATTYALPSKDVIQTFMLIFYTNFCVNRKKQHQGQEINSKKQIIVISVLSILALAYLFILWINGQIFLTAMMIGFMYFILFYYVLVFLDNYIDEIIKKSSIQSYEAKKYVFYWFFWIILFIIIDCMLYSGSEDYLSIDWIQNYIYCAGSFGKLPVGVPYNELIGPWFTFLICTCLFALIAAIFGIAHTFRNMGESDWFTGSIGQRVIRIIISNAFIIPSWILVGFQNKIIQVDWIRLSGLNEFFFNGIHFFFLYFWLFGLMPLWIFKKFKLVPNHFTRQEQTESQTQLSFLQPSSIDTQSEASIQNQEPFLTTTNDKIEKIEKVEKN